jgi:mycothiol synthase
MKLKDETVLQIPLKKDVDKAADLFNNFYYFCTGENRYTPESVLAEWEQPRFLLKDDARIITDDSNTNWVAYVAVLNTEPPYSENVIVFRINPDYLDCGIGSVLTKWAEKKAHENISKAPAESKVLVRASNFLKMDSSLHFLQNLGFSLSRYYFRMKMDLPAERDQCTLMPGITIETFTERKNLKEIIDCTEDCFLDHWGWWRMPDDELWEDWNHSIKSNPYHDSNLWFLAMDGDKLIGLCLADSGIINKPDTAYIDMICIQKEYRKKGIASYLLQLTNSELQKRNKKAVTLHVDGSSLTGATRVYEKAGFQVDQTRMMFEKIIREGEEYRSQTD